MRWTTQGCGTIRWTTHGCDPMRWNKMNNLGLWMQWNEQLWIMDEIKWIT